MCGLFDSLVTPSGLGRQRLKEHKHRLQFIVGHLTIGWPGHKPGIDVFTGWCGARTHEVHEVRYGPLRQIARRSEIAGRRATRIITRLARIASSVAANTPRC